MSIAVIAPKLASGGILNALEHASLGAAFVKIDAKDLKHHPLKGSFEVIILEPETVSEIESLGLDLKTLEISNRVPFLVYGPDSPDYIQTSYAFGALDYLRKGLAGFELQSRINSALIQSSRWETDRQSIRNLGIQLQQFNQLVGYLREQSFIDALTGIMNRRAFDSRIDLHWKSCSREGRPLSLIMIDIDFFKPYNDTYGHQAGDFTLKAVGGAISSALHRPHDIAARYGGEEFAVILPETPMEGAKIVAENIQNEVVKLGIDHSGSKVHSNVTVSQGVASFVPNTKLSADQLVKAADMGLYSAKKVRNSIEIFDNQPLDR